VHARLRADAQDGTRLIAEAIFRVVADWVLIAFGALQDYRMGGVTLSSRAVDCLRRMLNCDAVTQDTSGMSKGEWREFEGVIG
jgi:thymidylate synthase (FAD)